MTLPITGEVPSEACDLVMSAEHPSYEDGGPCTGCAFRKGSEASETLPAVLLARLCVEGIRLFHCHEHTHICRGFTAAINLRGVPNDEDDRKWCTVAGMAADVLAACIGTAKEDEELGKVS